MHVTGAGRREAFSFGDGQELTFRSNDTDPRGMPAVAPGSMQPLSPFNAVAGMSGLTALSPNGNGDLQLIDAPPSELMDNPIAAPISSARRGALRRLIDGIRRRS